MHSNQVFLFDRLAIMQEQPFEQVFVLTLLCFGEGLLFLSVMCKLLLLCSSVCALLLLCLQPRSKKVLRLNLKFPTDVVFFFKMICFIYYWSNPSLK